jgi:GH15 family glucan-1,4-alpha-glucosidase
LNIDDEQLKTAYEMAKKRLFVNTKIGGVMRFENDEYHRVSYDLPGNPWFIATLWCAQYEIAKAKKLSDLKSAKEKIDWAIKNSQRSGIMSEQVRADNGVQVSAAPLTWSHGEYVSTVVDFVEKRKKLSK